MSKRGRLLAVVGLALLWAALPSLAQQQQRRVQRIGFLSGETAQTNAQGLAWLRESMAELGWVEERDYVFDSRYGNGVFQAYSGLAAALVATRPDLLLTPGDEGVRALVQTTKAIPIVVVFAQDPVGSGYAASLQRPGGNVTGSMSLARDLGAKRLQLLKEAFPRIAHVGVLFNPADAGGLPQVKEIEEAAARLAIRISAIEVRQAADIEPAFQRGAALGADAYMDTQSFLLSSARQAIVDAMLRSKVPTISLSNTFTQASALMSYGPSQRDNFRRVASYVDKILKGTRPGDLPIQEPTKFELVLNLKTAKAMGITFPQFLLLRVDLVID